MLGEQSHPGATAVASFQSPFISLPTSRASPLQQFSASSKNAMAAPTYMPQPQQPFRPSVTSQSAYPLSIPTTHSFDRDATKPVGTPFSPAPAMSSSALIRRLPLNTSEESLRLMCVFSKELMDVEVLPVEQSDDSGFRSALLKFITPAGAQEAKNMLDGKSNISNDAKMIVEVLSGSPISSRRYPAETAVSAGASSNASSTASSGPTSRNPSNPSSRFNGAFQSLEKLSTPMNGVYGGSGEMGNGESGLSYQSIFSPQSPIGNHLSERTRISGKTLINNDAADDDDTAEMLKDPLAYAENSVASSQRRATAPQIPISRMAALTLNTNTSPGPASLPPYGHPSMGSLSAHSSTMSPTILNGNGHSMNYPMGNPYPRHNFPPVNPADQNPPCNTLYVGNLPIDTSEEELKAMFSKQRGYKRLCFRTKQNGPMCFVEFEDVSFATKALHELYGHPLHNSVKGGIRLSFSKNPLGVRSGQAPGQTNSSPMPGMSGGMGTSSGGFTSANGPPPGLSAPPGLSMSRMPYNNSPAMASGGGNQSPYGFPRGPNNGWNTSLYSNPVTSPSPNYASYTMGL